MKNLPRLGAAIAACAFLTACGSKTNKTDASASADADKRSQQASSASGAMGSTKASASAAAAPTHPEADPNAPGAAIISFGEGGVFAMDHGKLTSIGDGSVENLYTAKDGTVFVTSMIGASTYADGKLTRFETPGTDLVVGADGAVYALAGFEKEIAKLGADGKWTKEKISVTEDDLLMHIAVDPKGDIYVATMKKIFAKRGSTWSTTDIEKLFPGQSAYVSAHTPINGEVYVVTSDGMKTIDGKALALPHEGSFTLIRDQPNIAGNGVVAMHTNEAYFIIGTDGKVTSKKISDLDIKADTVDAFAVDTQGRRWLGANDQLFILDKNDTVLQKWPIGSTPGPVRYIAVIGAGPELPPAPDPIVKGNVKGRLTLDGEPVKNTDVVACRQPHGFLTGATPCSPEPVELSGKTDENGIFHFTDAPRGHYAFAFKHEGAWMITFGLSSTCCIKMTAGQELDIGDVTVKSN
jgi:hypothetical protein